MPDTALHPDTIDALHRLADITAGWLDKAGMTVEAATLRSLPPVVDLDSPAAAAATVQPFTLTAYRLSGVLIWPDAKPGMDAARDAFAAELASTDPYPDHYDIRRQQVGNYAGRLWTACAYAAHAVVTGRIT